MKIQIFAYIDTVHGKAGIGRSAEGCHLVYSEDHYLTFSCKEKLFSFLASIRREAA